MNKIRDGEISLNEAKDEQAKLKSNMGEITKVPKRYLLKESKEARINIEIFIMQEKQLLIFLTNILQRHLRLGAKQKKEQD